jgi:hypothetical protein
MSTWNLWTERETTRNRGTEDVSKRKLLN